MNFAHVSTPEFSDLAELVCFGAERPTEQRVIPVADLQQHPVLRWIGEAGLAVAHAASFYTAPFASLPPHVDAHHLGEDWCKLNLIFGGAGRMVWYHCLTPGPTSTTPDGLPYTHFDARHCQPIEGTKVDRSTLVSVGTPHAIFNISNHKRWALSLVLTRNGSLISVSEAYEQLVSIPLST